MPKSRFNAIREKARATRHNPTARNGQESSQEKSNGLPISKIINPTQQDAIPILKSLPLEDEKSKATAAPGDVLWALISLSSLLSDKSARTKLLQSENQLIARVFHQLQNSNEIQIRDAASGFLRNICIEAGSKSRRSMEERGNLDLIISEILATSKVLSFLNDGKKKGMDKGNDWIVDEAEEKRRYLKSLQSKPREQLNKKEKRHLAKLESANLEMKQFADGIEGDVNMDSQEGMNGVAQSSDNDERTLLNYSHLTNLFAILWSLLEGSPQVVDRCKKNAAVLCSIISSIVRKATQSIDSVSHTLAITSNGSANRVDIGRKDDLAKQQASMQLAMTALNTLVTLTDSDQEFAAAFIGWNKEELRLSLRYPKKSSILDEIEQSSTTRAEGARNIEALLGILNIFDQIAKHNMENRASGDLLRQTISIALLSAAVIRNCQACLPKALTNAVHIQELEKKKNADAKHNLTGVEIKFIIPFLEQLLLRARGEDTETLLNGLEIDAHKLNEDHILSQREKSAEDELSNLSLALEILAELASDPEGWKFQINSREKAEETISVDEESVQDMDEDENLVSEEEEQISFDEDLSVDIDSASAQFNQFRIAQFFQPQLIDSILALSVEQRGGFAELRGDTSIPLDGNMAKSLRSISIRALSVLNNQTLALASFARAPPSQPSSHGKEATNSFHQWLAFPKTGVILSKVWRRTFEYSSRIALLSFINDVHFAGNSSQDARKMLELSLCIMWSLSRCFEGIDGTSSGNVLSIEAIQFEQDDYCQVSRNNHGVISSLIAAYKVTKQAITPSMAPPSAAGQSELSFQLMSTDDGIRTHSLGIISTLVRQSFVNLTSKEQIVSLLLDTLDVLPTRAEVASRLNSIGIQDTTSMDAMVVSINGIIDTFADEKSEWDHLYSQLRMQSRLKRASIDVKASSRTIDKRKQPSSRAAAEESWRNLIAFIEYREGLVSTS